MIRTGVLSAVVWGLCLGMFLEAGFGGDRAESAKTIDKAIRKYQRLIEAERLDRAHRLARKIASQYPESPAAQLLREHSQLLAKSAAIPRPIAAPPLPKTAQAGEAPLITAQMLIVDVPENFFERVGIDFDWGQTGKKDGEPIGVDARVLPQPDPSTPSRIELVSEEEHAAFAVLPSEIQSKLLRAMIGSDCEVLSRPVVRTLPKQPTEIAISTGEDVVIGVKMRADISKDGKQLSLKIDGESLGETSHIEAAVHAGQTLLMHLGTHTKVTRPEQGVPILNKVPDTSRLFKNVIACETRHRLVFITPKIESEAKPAPPKRLKQD